LAARRFWHGARGHQNNVIGRQANYSDSSLGNLLPQLPLLVLCHGRRFCHDNEAIGSQALISTRECRHATFVNAVDFSDSLFELVRIDVAPGADDYVLDATS